MGARDVRVFGSIARGDDHEQSDVDFLVDIERGRSLLDVIGLEQDLQQLLGRRVEVLTQGGLSPHLQGRNLVGSRFSMKDDRAYLQHIRDALDDIARYSDVGREAFSPSVCGRTQSFASSK